MPGKYPPHLEVGRLWWEHHEGPGCGRLWYGHWRPASVRAAGHQVPGPAREFG